MGLFSVFSIYSPDQWTFGRLTKHQRVEVAVIQQISRPETAIPSSLSANEESKASSSTSIATAAIFHAEHSHYLPNGTSRSGSPSCGFGTPPIPRCHHHPTNRRPTNAISRYTSPPAPINIMDPIV